MGAYITIYLVCFAALLGGYFLYRDQSRKPTCGHKCKAAMHSALVVTGFSECSFDPTPGWFCDKCYADNKQLHIRSYRGEFLCCDCVLEEFIKMRDVR